MMWLRPTVSFVSVTLLLGGAVFAADTPYAEWITEMKTSPRGPFSRIRWFCADGSIQPPRPYACSERGGGHQHGEWNERALALRGQGYFVANVLAGIDAEATTGRPDFPDELGQLLVEKYLIAVDDGWILRKARFYRGALQEEDEREGARDLLLAMVASTDWTSHRFVALRTGARLLPHGEETASVQQVRQEAAALSDLDGGFAELRAKIHGTPEAGDAARVREYAGRAPVDLRKRYEALAAAIDEAYAPVPVAETLEMVADSLRGSPDVQDLLRTEAARLRQSSSDVERFTATAAILARLRDAVGHIRGGVDRLSLVDLGLAVDAEHFRLGTILRPSLSGLTRAELVLLLRAGSDAAYGAGLVNSRQRRALAEVFDDLGAPEPSLSDYHDRLEYAALLPGWSTQSLRMHFFEPMQKLGEIEGRAELFLQDQLRSSALFFYSEVIDRLLQDANLQAGVERTLFDRRVGGGLTALNPGLARGVLYTTADPRRPDSFRHDGIYLLPETIAELPPVAGILTQGAGNPLSHVQLLARNLGIPNVAVDSSLVEVLRSHEGKHVVVAAGRSGAVQIEEDGPRWDAAFGGEASPTGGALFAPDLAKLDLSVREFLSLDELRASDSGRTVGPKAAKLGELRYNFPEATEPGVAIPFGLYREAVLDKPHHATGNTVFEWMSAEFRNLEALPRGSAEEQEASESLRAEIYDIVRTTDPGPEFRRLLREAMDREFGSDFRGGVFVRSDTNVEDLPGFTGAGINLTIPNVVGFEGVMEALADVWASPFSPRSFAWRRGNMTSPEHVYPAVLLLRTVPSEKSGVMVTQDLETGDRDVLSIAVNEGAEGAVQGQAAETLRVDMRDGSVRLLAAATAPWREVAVATGGVVKQRASGAEAVLLPDEIEQLIGFARTLPSRFPPIVDGEDQPTAADVEFAFVGGKLYLLQIRPFNESARARENLYLQQIDQGSRDRLNGASVRMNEVPAP
ncbi:MAG TPA: PEP/pyruvate-binding domain-containing protein [Vicinamibacteria bacterium]|nr:PEP/pyruvate-binding domain-containing protein [Vicinamibacteria bacterium]